MGVWFTQVNEVFISLFVALSPLTVLPLFISMTEGMNLERAQSLSRRAILTAFVISVAIVLLWQALFRFLGITVDDLRVAGGLILLILSIHDLIFTREQRKKSEMSSDAGVVPLGTPLIVGPATMTTCVVAADTHGRTLTLIALCLNLFLIAVMLHFAHRMKTVVRPSISRAFGKVMSLFMAAIAVAMLRHGIAGFLGVKN